MKSRPFWKMSGSGNDFVFFDAREESTAELESVAAIAALCERRTGIGADGIVLLEHDAIHAFGIRYFNRDGTLAELCGNASLCAVTLAQALGVVAEDHEFTFQTSSGPLTGRRRNGESEIGAPPILDVDLSFPVELLDDEERIGFARVGVPHLAVLVTDADLVDVRSRGSALRHHPLLKDGANANFLSRSDQGGWRMRTYERGVEEETLACGSGAVACAWLLREWGLESATDTRIETTAGNLLSVALRPDHSGQLSASLKGEGRIVFSGVTSAITW